MCTTSFCVIIKRTKSQKEKSLYDSTHFGRSQKQIASNTCPFLSRQKFFPCNDVISLLKLVFLLIQQMTTSIFLSSYSFFFNKCRLSVASVVVYLLRVTRDAMEVVGLPFDPVAVALLSLPVVACCYCFCYCCVHLSPPL